MSLRLKAMAPFPSQSEFPIRPSLGLASELWSLSVAPFSLISRDSARSSSTASWRKAPPPTSRLGTSFSTFQQSLTFSSGSGISPALYVLAICSQSLHGPTNSHDIAGQLWGLKHHHHHHSTVENDQAWVARTILNLSPPDGLTEFSHNHFYPSLLYIAAHVFNFMNTLMYWAVLVPQGHGNLGGPGWLHPFSVVNLYGITSLIASVEVMFLNIIKHEHVGRS